MRDVCVRQPGGWNTPPGLTVWSYTAAGSEPIVVHNHSGATQAYVTIIQPTDLLNLHPGPNGEKSVVRWTAPGAGTVSIAGRFQGLDTGGTTTDVAVLHNGANVFGGSVNGYGAQAPFSLTRTVVAGDTVEFVVGVGSNGTYYADSTGLAALITPQGGTSAPGAVQWLVTDHLGTPRMVADQTGSLAGMKRHDNLPFGEEVGAGTGGRTAAQGYSGNDNIRQKWVGKERDAETGLDYFLARYYSSAQGRFTSPDEFQGGPHEVYMLGSGDPESQALPYADITEPQSLNKYQYCLNNPLRYVDPDGHQEQDTEDKRKRAAQGAAIHAGRTLNHDGRLRREYRQRAADLKGPEASAARKALRAEIRQRSTPLGKGLAEAASKSRVGQLAGKSAEGLAKSASRTSPAWNRAGAAFEGAGKALTVVGVGMSAYNIATAPEGQRGQVVAEESGAWTGALAGGAGGAKLGAVIGTFIEPGGGTAVGAAVGGVVGGVGGAIAGSEAGRAVYNWFTKKDD